MAMKHRIKLALATMAIIAPMFLFSQPSPGSGGPGGGTSGLPSGGQNNTLPIDGGVSIIIMMAVALGIKRQLTRSARDE